MAKITCRFCGKEVDKGDGVEAAPEDIGFVCDDHADHASGDDMKTVLTKAAASDDPDVKANAQSRMKELGIDA